MVWKQIGSLDLDQLKTALFVVVKIWFIMKKKKGWTVSNVATQVEEQIIGRVKIEFIKSIYPGI